MSEYKPQKFSCLRFSGWLMLFSIPVLITFERLIRFTIFILQKYFQDSSLDVAKVIFDSLFFVLILFSVLTTGAGIVILFLTKKDKKIAEKPDFTPEDHKIPKNSLL